MTIGRVDIVLASSVPPAVTLERAVRCALNCWPGAVVTDGEDAGVLPDVGTIAYHAATELLVFRSSAAHDDLRRLGLTPATANGMIDLIAEEGTLTVVVDDRTDPTTAAIVTAIESQLGRSTRLTTPARERVAS